MAQAASRRTSFAVYALETQMCGGTIRVEAVFDRSPDVAGILWNGYNVKHESELKEYLETQPDDVKIVIASIFVRDLDYNIRVREEIMTANLQRKGVISQHEYQGIKIDKIDLKTAGDTVYQDILAGRWEDWVECSKKQEA